MKPVARSSFRVIKDEIARRIGDQTWKAGALIPGEEALAAEFGAARATVNRALQELARAGLIERKRKVGTRVALHPVRQARFAIPLVAQEIAAAGAAYRYKLLAREARAADARDAERLGVTPGDMVLHLECLHLADERPYQFEDRLINPSAAPKAMEESFETLGPNEWLVGAAPFSRAEFTFLAALPSAREAKILDVGIDEPVFVGERRTWLLARPITAVRMVHPQSHRLVSRL